MYNLTSMDACRNNMIKIAIGQGRSFAPSKIMYELHHVSQMNMNFIPYFIEQNLRHVCLVLSDRALECMLGAVYVKENAGHFPPRSLSLEDIVQYTATEAGSDLDTVMFIHSIHFLAGLEECTLIKCMQPIQFMKLMKKVDDTLFRLSRKITSHPAEQYHSIFT